jgi:drug/metabolite transporter (DMT)-like permease
LANPFSPRLTAAFQALLVTFLWATSWVLIKVGLQDIPALTFAGLRYGLAFLCLLPFTLRKDCRSDLGKLSREGWLRLIGLGVLFYAITQGAQFLGLAFLPAVTVNLLLNFTTIMVAFMGILWLAEIPSRMQWMGIFLALMGAVVYFYPVELPGSQVVGVVIVVVGVVANAGSAVLGRYVNRQGSVSPLLVTTVSMGVGAFLLLGAGISLQGMPRLDFGNWILVLWLAVVNTAFAFTLWNHTLRTLSAMESSIINSTMLVQIPILAVLFLEESLGLKGVIGLAMAGIGALIIQWKGMAKTSLSTRIPHEDPKPG